MRAPASALSRPAILALAAAMAGEAHAAAAEPAVGAIAFDAFAIFDIRAVFARVRQLVPDRGDALRDVWVQKLFAYTWLRTTAHRYVPFTQVIAESLDSAAGAAGVRLAPADRDQLLGAFWTLPAWTDAADRLAAWRRQGLRIAFLSNMGEDMLRANLRATGLGPAFDLVLSTDQASAFKPAPEAYALAPRALGLPPGRIAFAAFAGWDAIGASWFGFPTAWVNRLGQPPEALGAPLAHAGSDLAIVDEVVRRA